MHAIGGITIESIKEWSEHVGPRHGLVATTTQWQYSNDEVLWRIDRAATSAIVVCVETRATSFTAKDLTGDRIILANSLPTTTLAATRTRTTIQQR